MGIKMPTEEEEIKDLIKEGEELIAEGKELKVLLEYVLKL